MSRWTALSIREDGKTGERAYEPVSEAGLERGRQRIAIEALQEKRVLERRKNEVWAELEADTPAFLRRQAD